MSCIRLCCYICMALILSSLALAECVIPSSGGSIGTSIFCAGVYYLTEPIKINTSNAILTCNGTILKGDGLTTGVEIKRAQNVMIRNCIFDGFHDSVLIDKDSSVVFYNTKISSSVNGVTLESGGKILQNPDFENVIVQMNKVEPNVLPEVKIEAPNQTAPIPSNEKKIVLFTPKYSTVQKTASLLKIDPKSLRIPSLTINIVRKYAVLKNDSTDIIIMFSKEPVDEITYVYEFLGDLRVAKGGTEVLSQPKFRVFEFPKTTIKTDFVVNYTVSGRIEDIETQAPITVLSDEPPGQRIHRKDVEIVAIPAFSLLVLLSMIVFTLYHRKRN